MLICFSVLFCAVWLIVGGCTPKPPVRGPRVEISKEDLIARLNKNSDLVQKIVLAGKIELKNSEHPNGLEADANFAFQKPAVIYLGVSKIGSNILIVKSDGKFFEACDFENKRGWVGRIEYLSKATDKGLFDFRPDFLSTAMALEEIDPAKTEMTTADSGDYLLTISEPDGTKRELYISPDTHVPVRQAVYGKDGDILLQVTYDKILDVTLPEGTAVFAPGAVTIAGRQKGAYLKIVNTDSKRFAVNNDRAFDNVMGPYGHSIRFPEGVEVQELQPDGTWKPIDIPPDSKGARIWRPEQND
jgi:hypothetical protein